MMLAFSNCKSYFLPAVMAGLERWPTLHSVNRSLITVISSEAFTDNSLDNARLSVNLSLTITFSSLKMELKMLRSMA